ncbi:hypothetical protein HK099_003010 [Clydaea vesicula]|uniref:Cilia- and flagella-associated protein 61 N-terminal domain-containing protein n=1 Tax=Clydaea vesicula TaxID=447962 RepID=A0AAD5U2G8_9FUNG|nr:hypothetical protein HK099_003010 [Clydaea vesicula]
MISIRRAELVDVNAIKQLSAECFVKKGSIEQHTQTQTYEDTEKILKQRFGNYRSIEDTTAFSVVGVREEKIIGFAAFTSCPPGWVDGSEVETEAQEKSNSIDITTLSQLNWAHWITSQYETKDIFLYNTKFLRFFVSTFVEGPEFLETAIRNLLICLPAVKQIGFFLNENTHLFSPLSTPKHVHLTSLESASLQQQNSLALAEGGTIQGTEEMKKKNNFNKRHRRINLGLHNGKIRSKIKKNKDGKIIKDERFFKLNLKIGEANGYNFYSCFRYDILPPFRVRKARVEDMDDLVPMLKKQHLLNKENNDAFLANLLESIDPNAKTLVAEVKNRKVKLKNIFLKSDNQVLGFMNLTSEFNLKNLTSTFDVTTYDNFYKDPPPPSRVESEIIETRPNSSKSIKCADDAIGNPISFKDFNINKVELSVQKNSRENLETVAKSDVQNDLLERNPSENEENYPEITNENIATLGDQSEGSASEKSTPQTPLEKTEPNAFCIRLFYLEEPYHDLILEVIKSAFNHFSDRDYCVLTMPTIASELGRLSLVQSKLGKTENHCLYVINRFTLSESIVVRMADNCDLKSIKNLVSGMPIEQQILNNFKAAMPVHRSQKNHDDEKEIEYRSFIATHQEQVVGFVILKTLEDETSYINQFDIEHYIKVEQHDLSSKPVEMVHFIINPLFEVQSRWFFEEVMRISGITLIVYPVTEFAKQDYATGKIVKSEMIPVKRRRQIQFPNNMKDGTKLTVNAKIVVVGGSDAGLSFLENLVYTPHLRFSNLTLISPEGIPIEESLVETHCFSSTELKQIGLDYYVNVIKTGVNAIDRVHKTILLLNELRLSYDYLILTPTVNFDIRSLTPKLESVEGVYTLNRLNSEKISRAVEKFYNTKVTREDVDEFQEQKVDENIVPTCVVYGKTINAYAAVNMLLKKRIPGNNIILVVPKSQIQDLGVFNNQTLEVMVNENTKKFGVKIYKDYKLSKWETQHNTLTSITIKSQEDKSLISIPNTDLLLYADEKSVDTETFKAINDSCLVFDGLLVIDKYFRTQDPYIFAAGSVCKYSSSYKTPWSHSQYNSREIGKKMAEILLPLFNSALYSHTLEEDDNLLEFTNAKQIGAKLPGNLNYFHFDRPRLFSQVLSMRIQQPNYGRDCVISNPVKPDYFRINVDPYGYIQSLTYLGERPLPTDNISCLYGLNDKILNRLVARFDEVGAGIADFITYLEEEWALPLYHDRFSEYLKRLTDQMLDDAKKNEDLQGLFNRISKIVMKSGCIPEDQRRVLYEYFERLPNRKEWDKSLFDYLVECEIYPKKGHI